MEPQEILGNNALFTRMVADKSTEPWICADNRERLVLQYRDHMETVPLTTCQMTVGDYAICKGKTILAIIERKTYSDYGSSLKDGRHDNKGKMMKLRDDTGCAVIYLVEGDLRIRQDTLCSGIPFSTIEASMMRLAVRDRISIFRTINELDTAQWLTRFCKSMAGVEAIETPNIYEHLGVIGGAQDDAAALPIDIVTAPRGKSDSDILLNMWACYRGITVETATEYVRRWSLADIILKKVPVEGPASYTEVKIFGKKITKPTQAQFKEMPKAVQEKMLACVPGISAATASELLAEYDLTVILEIGLDEVKEFRVGKSRRRLGEEVAGRILKLFNASEKKV